MSEKNWEVVFNGLYRANVPGGWVYSDNDAMCFVPEPDKCNYHQEYVVKCCASCLKERQEK